MESGLFFSVTISFPFLAGWLVFFFFFSTLNFIKINILNSLSSSSQIFISSGSVIEALLVSFGGVRSA